MLRRVSERILPVKIEIRSWEDFLVMSLTRNEYSLPCSFSSSSFSLLDDTNAPSVVEKKTNNTNEHNAITSAASIYKFGLWLVVS